MAEEGQVPAPGQEPATPPAPPAPPAGDGLTLEQAQAEIRKLRDEAAARRIEAREANEKLQAALAKGDPDEIKKEAAAATARAEAAEQAAKAAHLRATIEREARKLGIVDEDAAARLLDASAITTNSKGEPENVAALLTDMVKARPWLTAKPADAPSSGGTGNPPGGRTATLTKDEIGRMSPQQINDNWDAVQAALTKQ